MSSSSRILAEMRSGSGLSPTVKYVETGMEMPPSSSFVTVSSSSSKRLPATIAHEKSFRECRVASFLKASSSWPPISPKTKLGGQEVSRRSTDGQANVDELTFLPPLFPSAVLGRRIRTSYEEGV